MIEVTRRMITDSDDRVGEQFPPVGRDRLLAAVAHDDDRVPDGSVHGADAALGTSARSAVELGHDSPDFV